MRYAVLLKDYLLSTALAERNKLRAAGAACDLTSDHMGEYTLLFDNEDEAAKFESSFSEEARPYCPKCYRAFDDLVYSPDLNRYVCQDCANLAYAETHGIVQQPDFPANNGGNL
jgi:transposase-like protein